MQRIFFLTILSLIILTLGLKAQVQNVVINWDTKAFNPIANIEQASFKEATYLEGNNFLPIYNTNFSINSNAAEATFTNLIFQEVEMPAINKSILPTKIEFSSAIGFSKKESSLEVSCIPLRLNEFSGKVEQLISFDVQINQQNNFSLKKTKTTKTTSVLSTGEWHKVGVVKDAIYKIDFAFLQDNNILNQNLNFSNFGIFGQATGMLPESNSDFREDDLEEIALKIVDQNNNGVWESNDFVLFYGKGPDVWHYDTLTNVWSHTKNIYSDLNSYFITPNQGSGKLLPSVSSLTGATATVNSYEFRDFYEQELNNLIYNQITSTTMGSGREWYGEELNTFNATKSFQIDIPNIISSAASTLNTRFAATSYSSSSNFTVKNNGATLFNVTVDETSSGNGYPEAAGAKYSSNLVTLSSANNFEIVFGNSSSQADGFIDFVEVIAKANLNFSSNHLFFRSIQNIGSGNKTNFILSGASNNIEVWDITRGANVFKINGNLTGNQFQFTVGTDSLREFVAVNVTADNFTVPGYLSQVATQNLHGLAQQDMFIITPQFLASAANDLANFHRNEGLSVAVVDIEQIYNEFSSGQQDLSAIRDFLKMFYDRATNYASMPKYALLFGDASFDYKNRIGADDNIIPTYESQESFSQISSYCTDDYISFLDPNEGGDITDTGNPNKADIAIGRIPVNDLAEAQGVVDKIIHYNSATTMEDWRNLLTFVADDEDNNLHFGQVEQLTALTTIENIDNYNVEKIYLDAYSQFNGAGGDRYPDVNDVILRKLRTGTFLLSYTGHGGPKNWAQERVFNIEEIRTLENIDNLPLFITATCDFSPYDDSDFHSAGETLITNGAGGAIALITTTRLVFANQNFDMTSRALDFLFQEYQGRMPTVGEILMEAKNGAVASENNRKFVLLGDPALTLAYPTHNVVTTKINGLDISQIDTLKALSKVLVEGEVRTNSGTLLANFNGVVYPSVYDKPAVYQTKGQDSDSQSATFNLQNNILFKGKASVVNGKFSYEFIVPKDINYAFANGKMSYYAANTLDLEDANGHSFDFIVGGTADSVVPDGIGPVVDVFINDSTFAFGGLTDENPILLVALKDNSGINTVGNGVGHDIIGLLNENTQQQYLLNDFYSAKLDDFTRGNIEYPFNNLEDGRYSVRVKAWDVYNNPGEGYTEFVVASSQELALQHVFNYPNPFTTHTSFIFEHNRPGEMLNVNVQIFTVSGKLVKSINSIIQTDGYRVNPNEITWNGLDDYGDLIGRGVYIYKVNVSSESGFSDQRFEKLVILR